MTIINQIIVSLREKPHMWAYYPSGRSWELIGGWSVFRIYHAPGYSIQVRDENTNWFRPNMWQRFRLRRAVRKWQRRVM